MSCGVPGKDWLTTHEVRLPHMWSGNPHEWLPPPRSERLSMVGVSNHRTARKSL
jgi:hypothetical protein